jgi:polysaccharide biosynthesis transport protein
METLLAWPFLSEHDDQDDQTHAQFTETSPVTPPAAIPPATKSSRHLATVSVSPSIAKPRLVAVRQVSFNTSQLSSPSVFREASPKISPELSPELSQLDRFQSDSPINQRRVMVVAGVAIGVTAGVLTQVLSQAPLYEGSFEITAEQVAPTSPYIKDQNIQESMAAQQSANIAPPSLMSELVSDNAILELKSPTVLAPVVAQLQKQIPQLDYQTLRDRLTLTVTGQTLKIQYQDVDPQRVQLVLSELSQAYLNHGQDCQSESCKGMKFIEQQIPPVQARVQAIRTEIEQLQKSKDVNNLEAQLQNLDRQNTDLSSQAAQLEGQLAEAQQRYTQIQQRTVLKPDEAIAQQFLTQDTRYQLLLSQFQTLDQQFAQQFIQVRDVNETRALQAQYQRVANQLTQQAQSILPQYLANPASNTQNPVFQDRGQIQLLQQSILVVHSMNLMQARQVTLKLALQNVKQQRQQMIELLGKYDVLRRKLASETQALQQYFDQLAILEKQAAETEMAYTVVTPPDLMRDVWGNPAASVPDLQRNLGIGSLLGVLLGIGVAATIDRRKLTLDLEQLPIDTLMGKAKELADLRLREQLMEAA